MPVPITIADDSAFSRKTVIQALPPEWDVLVYEAENGQEAIDAVKAGLADVLFLDLTMPEVDGFQVLHYLNQHHNKTVVIVISTDMRPDSIAQVSELGAYRCLKKPLSANELHQLLYEVGLI
ncbi:chemotaxis protein CheY [Shewanella mangrovi]|uniref:Chemotaxis protein CheY n=1 Tax=Shewanella mangrovi TaxID=1515746 RepID=A0A094JZR2_9GAMM|nr:response regulator [Shewanella mangrovi]KFZ37861.1 chemotaxis protein CheY [Shewanella mangrovi]